MGTGKGQSQTEAAHGGDLLHAAFRADAIDLAQFASGPEITVGVEGQSLGMIEPLSVVAELFERNERTHNGCAYPSSDIGSSEHNTVCGTRGGDFSSATDSFPAFPANRRSSRLRGAEATGVRAESIPGFYRPKKLL